jgi:hypothetical protein
VTTKDGSVRKKEKQIHSLIIFGLLPSVFGGTKEEKRK